MAAATIAEKVPVDGGEEQQPPAAAEELAAQKREQRLRKFRELHLKRNEARKLNHQEVVEEDKRLKLPANWEAKKARLEWELQEEEKKKECAARGEDYEKVKLLEISAEDAERWERKKRRKNPDLGFSDYAAAQLRQYHRLTKQIKPDMETYERLREKHEEEFYPTSNSLLHGTHVPSTEEIDRMVVRPGKNKLKNETNIVGDVPIMMMQILTTLTKGMPNSTRRQKDSMGNIQLKLNRIWKEEQLSNSFRNCLEA
ncbi:pre-mRNA-splicing factor SYF2 isoform X1 [Balaenoptera musculus]|uniref:Pre-mRNA-splicing factor SYF2 n=1 Tax=Balaenoptera musculus TaxID=9771 RepID=A0A8B8V2X7_BALMU|nr:pre-mRNA-splicing factor SYF2 isoform X1 [Balaenoptera musculus]